MDSAQIISKGIPFGSLYRILFWPSIWVTGPIQLPHPPLRTVFSDVFLQTRHATVFNLIFGVQSFQGKNWLYPTAVTYILRVR